MTPIVAAHESGAVFMIDGNQQLRGRTVGEYECKFRKLPTDDWHKIAAGLGLVSFLVTDPNALAATFAEALMLNKPVLIDIWSGNYVTPTYDFDHYLQQEVAAMSKISNC